ncbi:uncharacterized protein LOC121372471 [Gigantopelta aegis]|uniref:uncharacterized protein LOC121372471 n=1 Tax=Gigantopelta aegis TaxID=1735272 RepID=UPI001B88C649|nr:uncharacterized protein LOC121372471 [Gigantopelta aegis]XP_041354741.1 uncharacterized protein LOC121372471 [Gigantopelta aegis]XP_041354750.1 uncharacterized protein LOC121372471 [Gigantopelta aegis]
MESPDEDKSNNNYGPPLPPQMKKQKVDEVKTNPSSTDGCNIIGPALPPIPSSSQIGPALPPGRSSSQIGPALPPSTSSQIGPTLPPSTSTQIGPALPPSTSTQIGPALLPDRSSSQIGPALLPDRSSSQIGPALPPDRSSSQIGPALPPDRSSSQIGPALPPSTSSQLGPAFPPDYNTSGQCDVKPAVTVGPALPPGYKSSPRELPPSYIGPTLPPGFKSSQEERHEGPMSCGDDDPGNTIGPLPSEMVSGCTSSAAAEFEERAQKMKDLLTEKPSDDSGPASRETWMTELPSQLGKSIGLNMKARNFRKRDVPDSERDASGWTDTPADRERKAKEKEKRRCMAEENQHSRKPAKEEKHVKETKKHKKSKHKESLLDLHQKERKKKKDTIPEECAACLLHCVSVLVPESHKVHTPMTDSEKMSSLGSSLSSVFPPVSQSSKARHSNTCFNVLNGSCTEKNAEFNFSDVMSLCCKDSNVFASNDEKKIDAEKNLIVSIESTKERSSLSKPLRKCDPSDISIIQASLNTSNIHDSLLDAEKKYDMSVENTKVQPSVVKPFASYLRKLDPSDSSITHSSLISVFDSLLDAEKKQSLSVEITNERSSVSKPFASYLRKRYLGDCSITHSSLTNVFDSLLDTEKKHGVSVETTKERSSVLQPFASYLRKLDPSDSSIIHSSLTSVIDSPQAAQPDSGSELSVSDFQRQIHSVSKSNKQFTSDHSTAIQGGICDVTTTSDWCSHCSSSHSVPNNTKAVKFCKPSLMISENYAETNNAVQSQVKNIYKNLSDFSLSLFEDDLFYVKCESQIPSSSSKDCFDIEDSFHKTSAMPWLNMDSRYRELPPVSSWTLPLAGLSGDASGTSTAIHHINTKMDTILEILKDTKQHLMTIENDRLRQVSDRLDRIEQCLRKTDSHRQGQPCSAGEEWKIGQQVQSSAGNTWNLGQQVQPCHAGDTWKVGQSCPAGDTLKVGQGQPCPAGGTLKVGQGQPCTAGGMLKVGQGQPCPAGDTWKVGHGEYHNSSHQNKLNNVGVNGVSSGVDQNRELTNHAMLAQQQPAVLIEVPTGRRMHPLPPDTVLESGNVLHVMAGKSNPEYSRSLSQKLNITANAFSGQADSGVQGPVMLNKVSSTLVQKENQVNKAAPACTKGDVDMETGRVRQTEQVILPDKQTDSGQMDVSVSQDQQAFTSGQSADQSYEKIYLPHKLGDSDTSWSLGMIMPKSNHDISGLDDCGKLLGMESGTDAESSSSSEVIRKLQSPGANVQVPVIGLDSIKVEMNSDGDDDADDDDESNFSHLDDVFQGKGNTGERFIGNEKTGQSSAIQDAGLASQSHDIDELDNVSFSACTDMDSIEEFGDTDFGKNPNCADYSTRTVKADRRAAKLFRRYLKKKKWPENFETFEPAELCKCLCHFFMDVRKEDGEVYKESSLQYFRYGLNRYLRSAPFNREFDITRDAAFKRVAKCYKDAIRNIRATGKILNHHPIISDEDRHKLYNSCYMTINTPQGLLNKVQFDIRMYLCRGDSMEMMTKSTFVVTTHPVSKLRCVRKTIPTKEFMCEVPGSPFCPVLSFEKYISKLSPQSHRLWQYPQPSFEDDKIWYNGRPVGRGKMEKFMAELSKKCKLSRCYTNQSIKTTGNAIMAQLAFGMAPVLPITGEPKVMQIVIPADAEEREGEA